MADIAINLKGNDNLTGTVKNAEKAVKDLGSSASRLNIIEKQFAAITDSGKPLQTQLRQIQRLMAEMNLDGLSHTDVFTNMAMEAGRLRDAISDASTATQRFSSDTRQLDTAVSALQGIAGMGSIATSAMALFGTENEKVSQAILKVQSAMGILNGIQAVANTLNKDSAVMQSLKAAKMTITNAVTKGQAVATAALATAEGVVTTKTKAATVAETAWNVAKAIGKALLGDFSGLLLVGVGALATYAVATAGAKDEQDELNDSVKNAGHDMETYTNTLNSSLQQQMTKYTELKVEWMGLRTEMERNEFIERNKNYFEGLGISIITVADAERFFTKATPKVCKAFTLRAKAAAAMSVAAEAYANVLKAQLRQAELMDNVQVFHAGDKIPEGDEFKKYKNPIQAKSSRGAAITTVGLDGWGAQNQVYDTFRTTVIHYSPSAQKEFVEQSKIISHNTKVGDKALAEAINAQEEANKELRGEFQPSSRHSSGHSSSGHGSRHTTKTRPTKTTKTTTTKEDEKEPLPQAGSIADFEKKIEENGNKIAELNKQIVTGNYAVGESEDSVIKKIDVLTKKTKELAEEKERLEYDLAVKMGTAKTLDEMQLEEETKKLEANKKEIEKGLEHLQGENSNINRNYVPENQESYANSKYKEEEAKITTVSSALDVLLIKQQELRDQLTANNAKIDFYHNLQTELQGLIAEYEELEAAAQDAQDKLAIGNILKGLRTEYAAAGEQMQTFEQQSGNIVTSLNDVNENIQKQEDNKAAWQNMQEEMQIATGFARDLGSAFSNMGDKSAKSIMDAAAATMTAVAQIIPQILKLIGVKQAEAMAEGVSSATKIGYPQNLIAIASIVATLMSTFATISGLKFAQGGIVPGGKFVGDHVLASVNSGEMILNTNQQRRLFNALNGGGLVGGNTNSTQHITLKVRGSDLIGAIKNYQKINGRKL